MTTDEQKHQNAKIIIAILALFAAFVICGAQDYKVAMEVESTETTRESVK